MNVKLVKKCIFVDQINKDANLSLPLFEASRSITAEKRVEERSFIDIKLRGKPHVDSRVVPLELKVQVIFEEELELLITGLDSELLSWLMICCDGELIGSQVFHQAGGDNLQLVWAFNSVNRSFQSCFS